MAEPETNDLPQGIAVVGMSGRFPGAKDISELWEKLCGGEESISFFNREELLAAGRDPALVDSPQLVPAGGVLDGIELFDAPFFGLSPREAEIIDPQQRLFLECAWHALEDAGYDPETFAGSIGVYAGANSSTYLSNVLSHPDLVSLMGGFQVLMGNDKDYVTTQVSYKLNLKGPSLAIQTACSTSLVAVCMACESLLDYHCDMALAGGVAIKVPQKSGYMYQEGMINSPDGHCRTFDVHAQGTVFGNGVGIVVLKRLAEAIADGDNIYAVIKGSALNNDGALKVGFTAPSVEGQAAVIVQAQAVAGVDPETISYVEAHGTATPLGDPIEIAALTQAFRVGTEKKSFCRIGSIKSSIGHLNTAAGVAGLIKTVLMLKHRTLPPTLHFTQPNPAIDFENSPFIVNDRLTPWKSQTPRRAGVSSFGIGGTNAHAVLEEAPEVALTSPARPAQLLLLSAKTSTALDNATTNLVGYLEQEDVPNLADVAYTTQVGRRAFTQRRMLVCTDAADAVDAFSRLDSKRVLTATAPSGRPVIFMFPGQGSQYVNMTKGLYDAQPTFRRCVDECAELLRPLLNLDLAHLLYPGTNGPGDPADQLGQTIFSQPALFVVEYALAQLWMEWGVHPRAMIGHSVGEYVAACLAGVFSLEEALSLIAARGRMMQEMPGGSMLAVALPEQEVRAFLSDSLDLAAVNASSLCVVSGPLEAVAQLEADLNTQGITSHRLHTSHAFHSQMMEPLLDQFTMLVSKVNLSAPQLPYISNLSGTWITAAEATDPTYWARHLRQTVRFADGLKHLFKGPESVLLEVGPGETLSTLVRQHEDKSKEQVVIPSVRRPQVQQSDAAVLMQALGRLWLASQPINWQGVYKHERRLRVSLPGYAFDRKRYWIESRQRRDNLATPFDPTQKRPNISDWFYTPTWKRTSLPARTGAVTPETSWLIFKDDDGVGSQFATRLLQDRQNVLTVTAGAGFKQTGDSEYTIDSESATDYQSLIRALRASHNLPQNILHFWSVTTTPRGSKSASVTNQDLGFYSLLYLAQALGAEDVSEEIRISVVSNGVHLVTGDETLAPEKATVLGACRVIPRELTNVGCRNIDLSVNPRERLEGKLLDHLLAEVTRPGVPDKIIAFRGNQRWVRVFEQAELNGPSGTTAPLRERGVYLITGGFGGIGFALAEHLARTVKARLVLVGRTLFPGRDNWAAFAGRDDVVARRIQQVQTLEEQGAEVLAVNADVTNEADMRSVLEKARSQFGPINGVIHAAGVAGGGMIQLKTDQMAESVLAPKLKGTLVLDALFENAGLDFLVLCSSLASLLGGFGQVDYCAANAFLDAFANAKANEGKPVIVINWDTWQEVGMAVETALPTNLQEQRREGLKQGILTSEGVQAFARILSSGLSQVAVSTIDLPARSGKQSEVPVAKAEEESNASTSSRPGHARPELATNYAQPTDRIEQTIANLWQELLGVEQVGIHDDFFELGGHSLLAVRMMSEIDKQLGRRIPLVSLFQNTTVAALAEILRKDVRTLEWPTLVEIQPQGSKTPLFCISTPNVNALGYRSLAHWLGEDQPVFGLQAQYPEDLDGEHSQSAVEHLAADYLTALRRVKLTGPYRFVGLCRGAHIAYEMARTLEHEGERVEFLGILDTWVLENTYNGFLYVEYYARRLRSFLRGGVKEQLNFLKGKVTRRRHSSEGDPASAVTRSRNPMAAYFPGAGFLSQTYGGDITVFRVRRQPLNRIRDPRLGWAKLTSGNVDVHIITGDHGSVLREPSVRDLAEELKKCL